MNNIQLHGELASRYGVIPPLDIRDPGEGIRALVSQLPDFGNVIRAGEYYVIIEDAHGKYAVDIEGLCLGMAGSTMHIVPAVEGAANGQKGKGTAKLVVGVALIAGSLFIPGMQGFGLAAAKAAWSAKILGTGIAFGHMAVAGLGLAFAGAALMISPQPRMPSADAADDKNSFIFSNPTNPSGQGFVVPPVFGQMRVGAMPVATRVETNEVTVSRPVIGQPWNPVTNWPTGYDGNGGIDGANDYLQDRS